jgi:hypothetical protein
MLDGLHLEVGRGECLAVVGPRGTHHISEIDQRRHTGKAGTHIASPSRRAGQGTVTHVPGLTTPSARFFSCPRCSVISSLSAVSNTLLVNSFNSPFGPVSSSPRSRAWATITAAVACSGESARSDRSSLLRGLTASDVITHSAHLAGPSARRVGPETPFAAQSRTHSLCAERPKVARCHGVLDDSADRSSKLRK